MTSTRRQAASAADGKSLRANGIDGRCGTAQADPEDRNWRSYQASLMEVHVGLITRRGFIRQTALGGTALYGCPLRLVDEFQRMFQSREQNATALDSAAIRKLASEVSGRVITTDAPDSR